MQEILRENGNAEAVFELGKITVFKVVVKENPEDAALLAISRMVESNGVWTTQKTTQKSCWSRFGCIKGAK